MAKPMLPSLLRDLPQYGNKRPFAGDVPQYSGPSQPIEPMTPPSVESQMLRAAENLKMPTTVMGTGGMPGAKSAGVVESQPPLAPNELPARVTPRFQSGQTKLPGLVSNVVATEAIHQGLDTAATAAPAAIESAAATSAPYGVMTAPTGEAIGTAANAAGAGAGATAAAEPGIVGLSQSGVGGPALATALYYGAGGLNTLDKIKNKETRDQGLVQAAMMSNPMTSWAWPAVSPVANYFSTGKDKDQQQRDATRAGLQGAGVLDKDYNFTLANGQRWNAGADGSEPIYQVQHPERPITGRVIGAAQVIASLMTGHPNQKDTTDLTGILTNMALSNSDSYEQAMENLMHQFSIYAEKYGITPDQSRAMMKEWKDKGLIDQQTFDAYNAAHESLIDGRDWQYDDNTANQPMEGQATPPAPSTELDLTKYLSPQQGQTSTKLRELPNATPTPGAPAPVKVQPGEKFPNASQPTPAPKPAAPAAPAKNMRPKVTNMSQLLAFKGAK